VNVKSGVNRDWAKLSPYDRFFDFIAPDADRFSVLLQHIKKIGLNSAVIKIDENRHFFIFPPGINLKQSAGIKFPFSGQNPAVLTAHYDRMPGSPGANDNSVSVFLLLKTAIKLCRIGADYWMIIFTDKEELHSGEGIENQGSYSLAKKLKGWGLGDARIFNFDACGTGETFVISTTADYLFKNKMRTGLQRARKTIANLREQALECARQQHLNNVLLIPTPFSDDAGFLQGGLPVQTITMLPAEEAAAFASLLRIRPEFADMLISNTVTNTADRRLLPETWRRLNKSSDSHVRLTPGHYEKIVRFAVELCRG